MRTVPGSEIVGSAELRRREHKTKRNRKKEKERKKSKTGENGERKGRRAYNLCQLFACLTLSRQFPPIISKRGTGYLTIG